MTRGNANKSGNRRPKSCFWSTTNTSDADLQINLYSTPYSNTNTRHSAFINGDVNSITDHDPNQYTESEQIVLDGMEEFYDTLPTKTQTVTKGEAEFDYDAVREDEITFVEGDILHIINKEVCDGWGMGEIGGKQGLFPNNYVRFFEEETVNEVEKGCKENHQKNLASINASIVRPISVHEYSSTTTRVNQNSRITWSCAETTHNNIHPAAEGISNKNDVTNDSNVEDGVTESPRKESMTTGGHGRVGKLISIESVDESVDPIYDTISNIHTEIAATPSQEPEESHSLLYEVPIPRVVKSATGAVSPGSNTADEESFYDTITMASSTSSPNRSSPDVPVTKVSGSKSTCSSVSSPRVMWSDSSPESFYSTTRFEEKVPAGRRAPLPPPTRGEMGNARSPAQSEVEELRRQVKELSERCTSQETVIGELREKQVNQDDIIKSLVLKLGDCQTDAFKTNKRILLIQRVLDDESNTRKQLEAQMKILQRDIKMLQ